MKLDQASVYETTELRLVARRVLAWTLYFRFAVPKMVSGSKFHRIHLHARCRNHTLISGALSDI